MKLISGFLHESLVDRVTDLLRSMDIPDLQFEVSQVAPRSRTTHNPGLSNVYFRLEIYVSDEDHLRAAEALKRAIPLSVATKVRLYVIDVAEVLDIN